MSMFLWVGWPIRAEVEPYAEEKDRLSALGGNLINSGADFPPTGQQVGVYKEHEQRLAECQTQYRELVETFVPQFKNVIGDKSHDGG